jgi:Leucine-rich repeat (LRR) protein
MGARAFVPTVRRGKRLSKLKDLVLDNNQISDVSPLRDLMTVQELYVGRNKAVL